MIACSCTGKVWTQPLDQEVAYGLQVWSRTFAVSGRELDLRGAYLVSLRMVQHI